MTLTPQLYTARFPALESSLFLKTFLFNSLHFELHLDNDRSSYEAQALQIAPVEVSDHSRTDHDRTNSAESLVVSTGKSAGAALTAGFVAWVLRAGTLASAAVSSLPIWRGFDPLPILPDANVDESSPDDDDLDLSGDLDDLFKYDDSESSSDR